MRMSLWGKLVEDIWNSAVSRCGCGVRGCGAGAVHVRAKFYPHSGVWYILHSYLYMLYKLLNNLLIMG